MTLDEFCGKKNQLKSTYDEDLKVLEKEFVLSNCRFKVGDIIFSKSSRACVLVQNIYVAGGMWGPPYAAYQGLPYTKDLRPSNKRGADGVVWDATPNDIKLLWRPSDCPTSHVSQARELSGDLVCTDCGAKFKNVDGKIIIYK